MSPQDFKDLSAVLSRNKALNHLDLADTNMDVEGVEVLMAALSENYRSEVKTLLLGGNNLGPDGAKKIGRALSRPPRLLVALNLENNSFGDSGCSSICRALRVNKTIQHLDLSDNGIGPAAGHDWAVAIQKNATLIFLSLSWNKMGIKGLLELVSGLQHNITLKYLNIIGNGASPDTGTALIEASLFSNTNPVDIDIDYHPPRSRQEILSTDTETAMSQDEADEDPEPENDPPLDGPVGVPPPPLSSPGGSRPRTRTGSSEK
jgi:Ran GTPase-activating protein (RanGAP) involved in mRNA processing and transport